MSEKSPPRLLILEKDEKIRGHARHILEQAGWEVMDKDVSKEALMELEKSKTRPFALFISSYKLPLMEGDDIMQKARSLSPMTQRMLLVPGDQTDILISAINKAGIHACITYPFKDIDLVNQAKTCLQQFLKAMKRNQLKRVTVHQNRQMFQIARKLKIKEQALKSLIQEKKTQKRLLETYLPRSLSTLAARVDSHNIPLCQESLGAEFIRLRELIRAGFDRVAAKTGLRSVRDGIFILPDGPDQNPAARGPKGTDAVRAILETAFTCLETDDGSREDKPENNAPGCEDREPENTFTENSLEEFVAVSISPDQTQAFIQKRKIPDPPDRLTLSTLLDLLREKKVTYGIIDNSRLESWIRDALPGEEPLRVAEGSPADPGRDGIVTYHFCTDYTNPGKILEDGSIDFRERGDIPFVKKGDILAVKTPARTGRTGMTVSGEIIPVDEVNDPFLIAEANTISSEDGLSITAALDGQPHVDVMGSVTVNPELIIDGDVDFQTGNIDFKGNIIVKGVIKEGFTIKGVNLTAQEIEGSQVDITGDLCISSGITESKARVQGSIHAKFINNSQIACFADLVVQKEIIDSFITLGGECRNPTGHIIASKIAAKAGIEAGRIGTNSSKPSMLKVGVDEHADMLTREIDLVLEESLARLKDLKERVKSIEEQDQELYAIITRKAQEQEQANKEIQTITASLPDMKKESDLSGMNTAMARIRKLTETAGQAEKELDRIFSLQDGYAKQIEDLKESAARLERINQKRVLHKKMIREYSCATAPVPRVVVQKTISQYTSIHGPNSSLTLKNDASRCRIEEIMLQEEGQQYYEMRISDL